MANGTATADDATQDQTFDPVAELRTRYPGVANEPDEKVIKHLSDPNNFRSAFPEYAHIDDATITKNMNKRSAVVTPPTEENLPGLTEKGRQNIKSGVSPMISPTKFEAEHTPEPENTGLWGRTKQYGKALANIGAGMLAPIGATDISSPYTAGANALVEDQLRKSEGRSGAYRAAAGGASLAGIDPSGMERAAEHGDPTGVGVEAAAQLTPVAAGEASHIPGAGEAIKKMAHLPLDVADKVARGTPITEAGKLEAAKSQAMTVKPPTMNETEYTQRVSAAMPELQRVAQENKGQINSPREADAAISKRIAQKEAPIAHQLATQTNPADLIHPQDYQDQVMQAVNQALNDPTKSYRPKDITAATKNISELIGDQPRPQTKIEADRRTLNDESDRFYKANPTDKQGMLTSDAVAVAQKAAADKIRELQYNPGGFFERAGITAVDSDGQMVPLAEFRKGVGNLMEVRNHFRDAIVKAEQTGNWKPFGSLFSGPSLAAGGIPAAMGAAASQSALGGLFGLLAGEGMKAWGSYLLSKNPNLNTTKMFRNLGKIETPPTTTDVNVTQFPGGQGAVRGALPAPAAAATPAGYNAGPSGAVRGGRWTTPAGLLPGPNKGLLPGIGETGRGIEGLPLPGTAELAHPEMFPQPSGTGVPETNVQRGAGGRMQRVYQGTSKPRPVGQTAEGGPILEGEKVPPRLGNIEAGAAPEAAKPTRLGNIGEAERPQPEVKHMVKPTETEETRTEAQKKSPTEIENLTPREALHEGDTFVDEKGEPRRITEITEDGTIKTADGTLRNYPEGEIQHLGDINSPRAQLARGGVFHPAEEVKPLKKPGFNELRETSLTQDVEGEGGRTKVADIGNMIGKFAKEKVGKIKPDEEVANAIKQAAPEIKYQMATDNSGLGWYDKDTQKAVDAMAEIHPELKDPKKASLFKTFWSALSYGKNPADNMMLAERAYQLYKDTGKMPITQPDGKAWGVYKAGHEGNLKSTQALIDKYGEEGAVDWLLKKHPTSELKEFNKNVAGKADEQQYGAVIYGPKGGNFYLNLNGVPDLVTVDKWMARTWRRWSGQLSAKNVDEAPSPAEIRGAREAVAKVAEKLKLEPRDAQAVLWYYEQELYKAHGATSEALSYGNEARRIVDQRKAVQPQGNAGKGGGSQIFKKAAKY